MDLEQIEKEIKYIKKQQSTLRYLIFSILTEEQIKELSERIGKYKVFQ